MPIIDHVLDRMLLSGLMDSYLPAPDPRSKVSTKQALIVLLKNILLSREPIYGLGEWAQAHAPDLLGLGDRQVKALNDDCVGRCLDRLFDADYPSMLLALMAHVIKEFDVDLHQLHNDSTTISFFGAYETAEHGARQRGKPTLAITYGHNKDHRPDLKQLLFVLTVAQDGGMPVYFSAADGNVTDTQTHQATWDLMCQLVGKRDFLYVADSKLSSSENMAHLHQGGGRFITVLSRRRKEFAAFRELVQEAGVNWKDLWTKVDENEALVDVYRISDQLAVTSEGYRLLWFHGMRKQESDASARSKRIESALSKLANLRERLRSPRTRYRLRAKVADAVEKILEESGCQDWIDVEITQDEEETYRQVQGGKPGKDTHYRRRVRMRFELAYELNENAIRKDMLTDGVFSIVTNTTDLSEREALLAYKNQPKVEKRFSQLKTDFEVAPVYLKNVARVEALMCVYFLALVTQALIERELRRAMAKQGVESLPLYPEGRPCKRPCTRRILDLYKNIQRHELTGGGLEPVTMVTELTATQRELLSLLGVAARSYGRRTSA